MKKLLLMVIVTSLVLVMAGSGLVSADEFKAALLVPSSINDDGWNQSAYQGLLKIEEELGAKVSYIKAPTPSEKKASFRDYGERGYDIVIGHGFQFQDPAKEIAPNYPDTTFITIGGSNTAENLSPVVIKGEDGFYLAGIAAAIISKTDKIGLIGGQEIPAISKCFRGFELGVESVDPDVEVMTTYVGSWEDVNAGYEAALSQINQGADIIVPNANAVGIGAFKASKEEEVYSFGYINDQTHFAPNTMLGSIMLDLPKAFLTIAQRVKSGEFNTGEIVEIGLKEDVTYIKWNEKLKEEVPEKVFEEIEKATEKIKSGEYRVPGEND
ncbi:MAG: BMP family protein [Halanaerobiales bacterium]|nr:BMP family protein [Halanaerobiales bacterium]